MRIRATIKELGKKLLRPVWTHVRARIDDRLQPIEATIGDLSQRLRSVELETNHVPVLDRRLEDVSQRLTSAELETNHVPVLDRRLEALERGWRQHVPGLLNAVSSIAAFGYELASLQRDYHVAAERANTEISNLWKSAEQATRGIGDLWQRVEFVRREIMYESKYGITNRSATEQSARILAPEKVDKARATGVRLNLGCGHIPLDGYINVDQRELPGVDIVADVGNLPFEERSLSEIFSAHVLEHLPQERLRRLLPYWRSLLGPKGTFCAVVPDGEAMLAGVAGGSYSFEHFREVLFGAQEYEGDFHFNLFTPDSLTNLLVEAGFRKISVPIKGRPNGDCFEFEIRGLSA